MAEKATGRARGGYARAESLTREARKDIATKAALARWGDPIHKATHGSTDYPLNIGGIEIPCYVLEDGRRVLSVGGMVRALGMSMGGARSRQGDQLYQFVTQRSLRPYVPKDLPSRMGAPIRFKAPTGRSLATGYEATILPDICEAVLAAGKADALQADQKYVAQKCKVLVRGLARVGIIALIDETTGYQRDCAKDALAKILDEFIAKELQPWVRTFPDDFYQEMFRLRGLEFPRDSVKRPQYFGALTNDIIYKRLAPGVLDELKKATLRAEYGRRKDALPWRLARNIGYPKLRELLGSVVAIMKLSKSWAPFMNKLNRLHPRHGKPTQTSFDFETDDDGKGL